MKEIDAKTCYITPIMTDRSKVTIKQLFYKSATEQCLFSAAKSKAGQEPAANKSKTGKAPAAKKRK